MINWTGQVCLRRGHHICWNFIGYMVGCAHECWHSPATDGKTAQLKPWPEASDEPHWSEAGMSCRLWYGIVRVLNTPKMSLLGVIWLNYLSFLNEPWRSITFLKILIIYHFPLKCIASMFMLCTQSSNITYLLECMHLKTLEAEKGRLFLLSALINLRNSLTAWMEILRGKKRQLRRGWGI